MVTAFTTTMLCHSVSFPLSCLSLSPTPQCTLFIQKLVAMKYQAHTALASGMTACVDTRIPVTTNLIQQHEVAIQGWEDNPRYIKQVAYCIKEVLVNSLL